MITSKTTRTARRRAIAYAFLVALCLLLVGASNTAPLVELRRGIGFALSPLQSGLSGTTRSAISVFGAITRIDQLRTDNRELQIRVQELEAENQRLQTARIENEALTALLGIRTSFDGETVAAQVVGRQFSLSERIVALDRGTDHGIAVGDPVLGTGGALVGSVMQTGPTSSLAALLNDPRSIVIGLVESTGATGEVEGRVASSLAMTKIPTTEVVQVGDRVVTAGIQLGGDVRSPFPRGLLIGRVVDVQPDPSDVIQTALLEPAASLDKLGYVLVVTGFEAIPIPEPGASPDPGTSPGADRPGPAETLDAVP